MTMVCKVCSHKKRIEIDKSLLAGGNMSKIAKKFDLPYQSVYNHRDKHISRQLVTSKKVRDSLTGQHLLKVIEDVLENCLKIMNETGHDPKRYGVSLSAAGRVLNVIEVLNEISANLREYQNTEIARMQTESGEDFKKKLDRLSDDELKLLHGLIKKMEKTDQGKRNDLHLSKYKHKSNQKKLHLEGVRRYQKKKKAEQSVEPRKLKRRKIEPKKIDEFDQMRDRLGMSNNPEPYKSPGWVS